jgi:hypothetical protein
LKTADFKKTRWFFPSGEPAGLASINSNDHRQ